MIDDYFRWRHLLRKIARPDKNFTREAASYQGARNTFDSLPILIEKSLARIGSRCATAVEMIIQRLIRNEHRSALAVDESNKAYSEAIRVMRAVWQKLDSHDVLQNLQEEMIA